MLDKIREMLGSKEIPDEVGVLYRGARDEREALILLKEARRRDEARRRRALQDVEVLDRMESQLLGEGRSEGDEGRKLMLARRIKEVRWKKQEIQHRIENIYNKRVRIFADHIQALETVIELKSEELPSRESMEKMAIRAREMLEDLDKMATVSEGAAITTEPSVADSEEQDILREFESTAEKEIEKHEIKREELQRDLDDRAAGLDEETEDGREPELE